MTKIKVILCSNSGIDYVDHPYDIDVFRSVVVYSAEEQYDDYTQIKADDFYRRLIEDKDAFPHTAYCTPGKMIETFERAKADGYEGALVILISKPLSGLNNAVKLYAQEVEDFPVTVYDSNSISYPQAYMGIEACRMFSEGASLEEVLQRLDYIKENHHIIFTVDTLEYLIKNGRLSKFTGFIANMLSIRPILHLNKEGKVETITKERTSKRARKTVVEMFLQEIEGKKVDAFILHALAKDEVLAEVESAIKEARPDIKTVEKYLLTPVVGSHTGPGTIALGYVVINE